MRTLWREAGRSPGDTEHSTVLDLEARFPLTPRGKNKARLLQERFAFCTSAHLPLVTHTQLWGTPNAATVGVPKSRLPYLNTYSISWLQGGTSKDVIWCPPQAGPRRRTALSLCFWEYVFPWKRAASGKDPLRWGAAVCCNTLVWQRRLRRPCSCPGQRPGALTEGASSRVQDFYESQTCRRGPVPSSVCSWFYQLPFLIKLI